MSPTVLGSRRARLTAQRRVKLVALFVAGAGLAGGALTAGQGALASKPVTSAKSIVLGKTRNYPDPACMRSRSCQVIARVSGIQMAADGVRQPFRVPEDGQLVAWWLRLPRLSGSQIKSFNRLFGGAPEARVAVLRRGIRDRYRLLRQSDSVQLQDKLGSKRRARFRLSTPLAVKEGDYIGISAVTWMPSFAVGLNSAGNRWLASRGRSRCRTPSSREVNRFKRYYKQNDAQLQTSTAKSWQCSYETARLIYWARIVPGEATPAQN
jgi:hypothetical protein